MLWFCFPCVALVGGHTANLLVAGLVTKPEIKKDLLSARSSDETS